MSFQSWDRKASSGEFALPSPSDITGRSNSLLETAIITAPGESWCKLESGMNGGDSTCWTVIHAAAAASRTIGRNSRAVCPVVRDYLASRWRDAVLQVDIDDALQDVFVECFRQGGALWKADEPGPWIPGFPLWRGAECRVALRAGHCRSSPRGAGCRLGRPARSGDPLAALRPVLGRGIVRAAAQLQMARGRRDWRGRRSELLRLRSSTDCRSARSRASGTSTPSFITSMRGAGRVPEGSLRRRGVQ